MSICEEKDCLKEAKHRGMCWRHYLQLLRYGKTIKNEYDPNIFNFKKDHCTILLISKKREKTGEAIIETEDYEKVKSLRWGNKEGYAYNAKNKITLSRFLMFEGNIDEAKSNSNILVDHANMDTLDNRRTNLRFCTQSENAKNRTGKKGKKEPKGVCYYPYKGKEQWLGRITIDNKLIHLGYFSSEKEATLAYNKAALIYHGNFAKLNIIGG